MKSLTERWNALGAEIGAALIERWSAFAPSWADIPLDDPRNPFHDVVAPRPRVRASRGASVVALTTVDKMRKTNSNPGVSSRRAA